MAPPAHTAASSARSRRDETRARILDAAVRVMAGGVRQRVDARGGAGGGCVGPDGLPPFRHEARPASPRSTRTWRDAPASTAWCRRSTVDDLRDGVRSYLRPGRVVRRPGPGGVASPASDEPAPAQHARSPRGCSVGSPTPSSRVRPRPIANASRACSWSSRRHRPCGCGATTSAASVDEAADDIDWVVRAAIAAATPRTADEPHRRSDASRRSPRRCA